MTTPTPDQVTDDADMPGVTDFEVIIPFGRITAANTTETTALRVRVPAANNAAACKTGGYIAEHVSIASRAAGAGWTPMFDEISAVDVKDVPDPIALIEQLKHWQRIVTAIADKYPTMVQVSAAEYAAADPSQLVPVQLVPAQPGDDTIMYVTKRTWEPVVEGTALGTFLLPAPAGVELPAGDPDPDVRGIKVQNLPIMPGSNVIELLHDGQWMPITEVEVGADLSVTVTLMPADKDGYQQWRFNDLEQVATIRPAAVLSQGSDLPAAAVHGRQLLASGRWWTVWAAEYTGPLSGTYKVTLVKNPKRDVTGQGTVLSPDDETRTTSYTHTQPVQLRDQPPKWWA